MSKIINPDSFKQLIEDIIKKNGIENEMTTPEAIESLKNSTEKYMRDLFNYSNIIAGRANKSTVTKKELKLALKSNGKVNKRYNKFKKPKFEVEDIEEEEDLINKLKKKKHFRNIRKSIKNDDVEAFRSLILSEIKFRSNEIAKIFYLIIYAFDELTEIMKAIINEENLFVIFSEEIISETYLDQLLSIAANGSDEEEVFNSPYIKDAIDTKKGKKIYIKTIKNLAANSTLDLILETLNAYMDFLLMPNEQKEILNYLLNLEYSYYSEDEQADYECYIVELKNKLEKLNK